MFLYFQLLKKKLILNFDFSIIGSFGGIGGEAPDQGHRTTQRSGGVSMYPCVIKQ